MNIGRLTDTLIRHEGSVKKGDRHMPYEDSVGKVTIGYGRNLTDRGISETEARYLLMNDIQDHLSELRKALHWFDSLDEVRQEVLANMAFNLGVPGLLKFKNTLSAVHDGNYTTAAHGMLDSKWASQVGHRAVELAKMMETGEYEQT